MKFLGLSFEERRLSWECERCGLMQFRKKCTCHGEPVLTKKDFVQRYEQGEFGNCSPTWHTFQEWCADHLGDAKLELFHIRNRIAGAKTWYNVAKYEMADKWVAACREFPEKSLYISAMCPTEKTLIQGEVMRRVDGGAGLDLYYSTIAKPMREALALGGKRAVGSAATMLLQHYLDCNSYDWLMGLLERYEDHVVEFTTLSTQWGTVPGFNSLFWEVRKY